MQLDLFLDSRAVVLANEIAAAVLVCDGPAAVAALNEARLKGLDHPALPALETLASALVEWRPPARNVQALAAAVDRLDNSVVPAAQSVLGQQAPAFVAHFFGPLSELARDLPYDPLHPSASRASLLLRCGDFEGAGEAVLAISDWRRAPDALRWLTLARYRARGLDTARGSLFAFAWLRPMDVGQLLSELADDMLDRDWRAFEAASDWESIPAGELAAWFPAWYLVEHPATAASLDPEVSVEAAPAVAARTILHLLELERQGNSRALAASRARLRTLNADLFAVYMARRRVLHG